MTAIDEFGSRLPPNKSRRPETNAARGNDHFRDRSALETDAEHGVKGTAVVAEILENEVTQSATREPSAAKVDPIDLDRRDAADGKRQSFHLMTMAGPTVTDEQKPHSPLAETTITSPRNRSLIAQGGRCSLGAGSRTLPALVRREADNTRLCQPSGRANLCREDHEC